MPIRFITSTGTGMGKTHVTRQLIEYHRLRGEQAIAVKPIESGFDDTLVAPSDAATLLTAQGLPVDRHHIERITPWRFAAPLSPHMAAEQEQKHINFAEVCAFCKQYEGKSESVYIEGAGGLMVPINAQFTFLDLICALSCEVILVVGAYLGSISHTLTAIACLNARGANLKLVIVNDTQTQSSIGVQATQNGLAPFVSTSLIGIECDDSTWLEHVPESVFKTKTQKSALGAVDHLPALS